MKSQKKPSGCASASPCEVTADPVRRSPYGNSAAITLLPGVAGPMVVVPPETILGLAARIEAFFTRRQAPLYWENPRLRRAVDWLEDFKGAGDKEARIAQALHDGVLEEIVAVLPDDLAADEVRDHLGIVLDWAQKYWLERGAQASLEDLGRLQAEYVLEMARTQAGEDASDTALDEAFDDLMEQDYIVEPEEDELLWPTLSEGERAEWERGGQEAIDSIVELCAREHPELDIRRDQFELAFEQCEAGGSYAFTYNKNKCYMSMDMVRDTLRDPRIPMRTVIHELHGHKDFDSGFSVSWAIFDESLEHMPAAMLEDRDHDAEWRRYKYFESEIGAVIRSHEFGVATLADGSANPQWASREQLSYLVSQMAFQWAPGFERAYWTSLLQRFTLDPRVSDDGVAALAEAVRSNIGIDLRDVAP